MDIINSGIGWLEDQRSKFLTEEVTYVFGTFSVTFLATRGETRWEEENYDTGVVTKTVTRDWIIAFDQFTFVPEEGAHIIALENGVETAYELITISDNPFFKLDQYQKAYRIHTQNVPMIAMLKTEQFYSDDNELEIFYSDDAETEPFEVYVA